MKELSGDDIEKADDIHIEHVDVPEWGGRVYLRTLKLDDYLACFDKGDTTQRLNAKITLASICDRAGNLLIPKDRWDAMMQKSGRALLRLVPAAKRVNGMDDDEGKDSEATPEGSSPADSPSLSE